MPWDRLERGRLISPLLKELSTSVFIYSLAGIKAVDERNSKPFIPQDASNFEETQGLYPEIVRSEIGDPRVNEKDMKR